MRKSGGSDGNKVNGSRMRATHLVVFVRVSSHGQCPHSGYGGVPSLLITDVTHLRAANLPVLCPPTLQSQGLPACLGQWVSNLSICHSHVAGLWAGQLCSRVSGQQVWNGSQAPALLRSPPVALQMTGLVHFKAKCIHCGGTSITRRARCCVPALPHIAG